MEEEEDVLEQLKLKIEDFFKSGNVLKKIEDLDKFLEAIDLLDVWNKDEEKELVWQCLNKYNKKGVIDYNGAISGIKDLINQDEEQSQQDKNRQHETILTHLSRSASIRDPRKKGKFSIMKLKEFALDEYECVDNDTLVQLKKIFNLLNISKDNSRFVFNTIKELCAQNKFIKITPEEIWKYLSFLSEDNNEGMLFKAMTINNTLYTEIDHFITEKINEVDSDSDEDDSEDEKDNDKKNKEEVEPADLIDDIINNNDIQEKSQEFADIVNGLKNLTDNIVEKAENILNGENDTLEEVLFVKDLMMKKINEITEHNKSVNKQQIENNEKMEKIQFYVNKLKNDNKNLEEDFKHINNKYENLQKNSNTNDDEVERLFGENLMLYQDKEAKEKQIKELNDEKEELENKYNNLFSKLEISNKKNAELEEELKDIKVKSLKLKTNYEDTLEKLVNLEKVYNQELLKNEKKKSKEEEDLEKEEDVLAKFAKMQGTQIQNFMANKRKSQLIVLPKNIQIPEDETNEEKLLKYVKELEKMNEILTERSKDSAMKVKELESLFNKNKNGIHISSGGESDPNKLLKLNEIFNPSLFEIFTERICLISYLSNFNPKKNYIVKKYNFKIGESKSKNNKKITLLKQNSTEINIKGIIKQLKRQPTFDISSNIISSNSSFLINTSKPKKEEKPKIKLSESKFSINILKTKKKLKLEKTHTDLNLINKNKTVKKFDTSTLKEDKVSNFKLIIRKLSIEKKRNELANDSKTINLLFNDDSNTLNKKKIFDIEKIDDDKDNNILINKVRSGTIMINPKELFDSKDYYCLYQEDYVKRKLGHLNDICSEKHIYSDQIYVLVEKKQLVKKYILLSPNNFSILDVNTLKFVYIDKIKNIKNIVLSNKNLNMILFRFSDGEDLFIESLRCFDLISFMKENYYSDTKENESIFRYEDKFIIKLKNQLHSLVVTDKILNSLPNFDGASKVGYLSLYKGKFISSIFTETIGVLIEVGLLLVEEASLKPIALIPILGSTINKVEKERFGNNNCFEIILPNGTTKVFSARKTRERDSWLVQFSKMKKDFNEKIKKIGITKVSKTNNVALGLKKKLIK